MTRQKPLEACRGSYTALPHSLLDSTAFMGAGHTARSLLCELLRQHNGNNNGHFQLASSWLRKRGWTSNDVIHRARLELIERGLIIQTRQGGLNTGPNLYAVTWLPIVNFVGLDIQSGDYHPGKWHFMDSCPVVGKHKMSSVPRCGTAPLNSTAHQLVTPSHSSKTELSCNYTTPFNGNNEYIPIPPVSFSTKRKQVIVGIKGRSGKKQKSI